MESAACSRLGDTDQGQIVPMRAVLPHGRPEALYADLAFPDSAGIPPPLPGQVSVGAIRAKELSKNEHTGKSMKYTKSPFAPDTFPDLPAIGGLRLAGAEAGIRGSGRPDLMLAELAPGTSFAGVFTRSATCSPAVAWSRKTIRVHRGNNATTGPTAILVNSGNANAFTGSAGRETVIKMATLAAKAVGSEAPADALVASTGVIGEPLPVDRIVAAMESLVAGLAPDNWELAARAIMTTDTYPKGATAHCRIDGQPVHVAGIAKGSGMIAPDMATMLAFLFTDARINPRALQALLGELTETTFNSITVDGDCSTSDTVILAATGAAGGAEITDATDPRAEGFRAALHQVMQSLALQVVRDGEGASKFVTIRVEGADSDHDAKVAALAVANSPLVKTAIAGEDPNWGRIVMAVGKSGAPLRPAGVSIRLGELVVTKNGAVHPEYSEEAGAAYMRNAELEIRIDLGREGPGQATVWTCDLGHRYVEINADYRS